MTPSASTARVGDEVALQIVAASSLPVVDAPLHLLYDSDKLRFVEATEGEFLKGDGSGTVFLVNGKSTPGDVVIGGGRTDRSRGARGSAVLCRVRFEVLAPGTAEVSVGQAMAWSATGAAIPVTTSSATIDIH